MLNPITRFTRGVPRLELIDKPADLCGGKTPLFMAIQYGALNTESLAKQIADKLREAILQGDLQVDERLPTEEELATRFEVSRPTVREALKRLAAQNLIRSQRGPSGGTFVNRPSQEEVRQALTTTTTLLVTLGEFELSDIAEARRELELLCCRLAVAHRGQEHLDAMAREIDLQNNPKLSDEDFCASDVRFHRALVDATGNPVLQFVMFTVIEALQPVANMIIFRFRQRERIVEHHKRIYAALQTRDLEGALAAVEEQMLYLRDQYASAQHARSEREAMR